MMITKGHRFTAVAMCLGLTGGVVGVAFLPWHGWWNMLEVALLVTEIAVSTRLMTVAVFGWTVWPWEKQRAVPERRLPSRRDRPLDVVLGGEQNDAYHHQRWQ